MARETFTKSITMKILGILGIAVTALAGGYGVKSYTSDDHTIIQKQIDLNYSDHTIIKNDVKDGFKLMQEQMNRRFDSQQKQLDQLISMHLKGSDENVKNTGNALVTKPKLYSNQSN